MFYIKSYEPDVCPNEECLGYGDSVPAEHNRCMICHHHMVHYSEIPYEDVNEFVRRCIEHIKSKV